MAGVVGIAVLVGVAKIGRDMIRWGVDQDRDKKPWERGSPNG